VNVGSTHARLAEPGSLAYGPLENPLQLIRLGPVGQEKPAVRVDATTYVDVSDIVGDFDERFFGRGGTALLAEPVAQRIASGAIETMSGQRVGAPIARPHQILCIGLNYRDHAAETGQAVPDEPIVFNKAPNTIVGPDDTVYIPRGSTKPDWEVELGVVVGRRCRYLADERAAAEAIAGYTLVNDVSERAFQLERGGQWVKGKSAETFNPCGPYLVTPDEVGDVDNLNMWLDVNGVRRQTGSTATMLFGVTYLVYYLSQFMVLEPGDLINTGTPPGVAMGSTPPNWLRPGDVMELGIDKLGTQRQLVAPAP
jgi:2,4-diketo-3-deoxy-L-fuconate hydrolase